MSTDQGQKLFDKLSELNYPKISKFNPSSFDWLFDSDEALPFLDWFCDSIHSGLHLLSDSELKKFEALEKSGVTILEGDLLQEALSGRSEEEVTDEDLEAEIEQLRSRKEQLLAGKQNSIRQLNQLNAQEKAASVKISAAEEEAGAAEMAEEKLVEKLSLQSSIVHQVAAQLVDTTASIVERLGGSRLLCQTDLQQFLQHEEDYTALLTKYANTQFQEKMAAMGQNSGSELCAFVKIGDPNDLADILGLDAETRVIQNWELDRLQNLLPLAEEDRIVSQAEAAASRAAVDAAKALLNDLDAGRFPSSPVRIK